MQRYSENRVRDPHASRGLAGARGACCCAASDGVGLGPGGCATAAGSAGVPVSAGLVLARDADSTVLAGDPAAVAPVDIELAIPASAAFVGPDFSVWASAAIAGVSGAAGPTAAGDS